MKTNETSFVKKYHIIPWIVCILLAFIIWLYVMEVDSPDYESTFTGCTINVIGVSDLEENDLAVFSGADVLVDVTVKGQQTTISKYTSSDISVSANVTGIDTSGNYNLELYFDTPSGLTYVESSVESVNLYIDKKITKNVEVMPKISSYQLESGFELGDITASVNSLSVTGAETIVNGISYAVAEVNMSDATLTGSITTDATILLYDVNDNLVESRYIRLSQNSVSLTIPVYTTKAVSLEVDSKYGYFTDKNTDITISPATVMVKGDAATLNNLDAILISTLNEKSISEDTSMQVDITLPEGVTLVAGEPESATVDISFKDMVKKSIKVTNIKADVYEDTSYDILTNSLTINVFGEKDAVTKLTADDITLVANLEGYTSGSDATVIYPTVTVEIKTDGVVYELGSYSVQMTLK